MERGVGGTNLLKTTRLFDFFWKIPKNLELATFAQFWAKGCTYNVHHYETFVVNNPSSRSNQDFVTFSEFSEKGRPRLEYTLTLDKTSLLGLETASPNTIF